MFRYLLLLLLIVLPGCGDASYPDSARYHFQPYTMLEGTDTVKTYTLAEDRPEQMDELLLPVFGTPKKPLVQAPGMEAELTELGLTPELMAKGSKLFLVQCSHCHGKEGNGNGKSALTLNPKPRDFRTGKFKYVSTVRSDDDGKPDTGRASYPARLDVHRTIKMGLPGAGMSKFDQPDEQLNAIVSYVIHLSIRGQVEYRLTRFWLEEDEKPGEKDVAKEVKDIVKQWASDAKRSYTPSIPWEEVEREGNATGWAKGKELFLTKAGCIDCHGKDGMANPEELKNIAAMKDDWGAPIKPRSFVSESFRGGDRPIDLFYRIRLGIKPSRMQAIDPVKFSDADVWNLVGFIRSLGEKKP
ncbi:MAG: c-type cytochrome [Gemmatales bacterium]